MISRTMRKIDEDLEFGAKEAAGFVKKLDFSPSTRAFDAAFEE